LKLRLTLLSMLVLVLAVVPAIGQEDLYDNGPTNGTVDAWTINFGFVVSDSFLLGSDETVQGLSFAAWLFPGDVLQSAEVSITSSEFGGTFFSDEILNFTQSGCTTNQLGFYVCTETGTFTGPVNLSAGTYWLNLQNAVVNNGDPVYWDENAGPSMASENSVGSVPSESFTVLGSFTTGFDVTVTGTTPEPGSMMLFGSGIIAACSFLCRKLSR